MKIDRAIKSAVAQRATKPQPKVATRKVETAKTGWQATPGLAKKRAELITVATKEVHLTIDESLNRTPTTRYPRLAKFGERVGMALGIIVTEALALLPRANKPLLDAQGKPVKHIPGADRMGQHDILNRHQEVVGPKITALVKKLPAGVVHDLFEGIGIGATSAPGTSYRLESKLQDRFKKP